MRLPFSVDFSHRPPRVGVLVKSDVLQRPRQRLGNHQTSLHGARKRRRLLEGERLGERRKRKEEEEEEIGGGGENDG